MPITLQDCNQTLAQLRTRRVQLNREMRMNRQQTDLLTQQRRELVRGARLAQQQNQLNALLYGPGVGPVPLGGLQVAAGGGGPAVPVNGILPGGPPLPHLVQVGGAAAPAQGQVQGAAAPAQGAGGNGDDADEENEDDADI